MVYLGDAEKSSNEANLDNRSDFESGRESHYSEQLLSDLNSDNLIL